jgi:hypothetical protein
MDGNDLIDRLTREIASEEKDFAQARAELKELGYDDDYIDYLIRYIDSKLISGDYNKVTRGLGREYFYVGLFLLIAGLAATLGTYFGLINTGNMFIITYGPIIVGLGLVIRFRP